MIDRSFVRMMARYNRWQNGSLYAAAGGLDEAARRAERGAFFGSIHGTLSHILWADAMWMSRFWPERVEKPGVGIKQSPELVAEWSELCVRRVAFDDVVSEWAGVLAEDWLAGDLTWFSGAINRQVTRPAGLCVAHFFNHQTHHRGQVHAMLTAAGAQPEDTDIFLMTEETAA